MKKGVQNKIKSCKALRGKSVYDVIAMQRFVDNLAAYWTEQKETRKTAIASYQAMRKLGGPKNYKLPAHPIDDLAALSVDELAIEFTKVLSGYSKRCHAERLYIKQIGQQAYNLTVAQLIVAEFPELEDELIPKAETN